MAATASLFNDEQPAVVEAIPDGCPLVLLRHGQSEWNRDKRFTGWTDVALSARGRVEAVRAGERLRDAGHTFDLCCTSVLQRATQTSRIVLDTMGVPHVPIEQTWRLNERHYGALQGLDLWRAVRRHGLLPVLRCQYQFRARPPALTVGDARFPGHDPLYQSLIADDLPRGESHADTLARLLPYWRERIVPALAQGRRILIVSHKNTLRALLAMIEPQRDGDKRRLRVPTGVPIVFLSERYSPTGWRRVSER